VRCRKARWYLSARCDGTLSQRHRGRLDEHLAVCPECRRESFYFSEIGALAGRMETVSVRPDFDVRLRAAIRRAETSPAKMSPWYRRLTAQPWRLALVTGSLAIVFGLSYGAYRTRVAPSPNASLPVESKPDPKKTLEYFGNLVSGQGQPGMSSGWLPVDGASPEALRLRNLYLDASRGSRDYLVGTVGLDDPNTKKPSPRYVMPVERSDDMVRKVSY